MTATASTVYALVLGQILQHLREEQELTQSELAAKAGLTQSTLSRVERGQAQPDPYTLRLLANALGKTTQELESLVDKSMKQAERAAESSVPGAAAGTWWKVVGVVLGAAGLVALVGFAVALAMKKDGQKPKSAARSPE